jgi:predicted nucleic acid-binding protein
MAFVVIYDACVLYPAPLRDLLVRFGMVGVVRARWTEQILDECFRSILEQRPDLKAEALVRTRELMRQAVADCTVAGYEHLIDGLRLPDPDDRHVLAAAIRAGAQAIVTFNIKDFPPTALEPYDIEALHPDEFVLDLLDLAPAAVANVIRDQADALKSPPRTIADLLDTLQAGGLVQSVAKLRGMYPKTEQSHRP